tara:strand:+ start:278 stop:538 length:261 start_codon:yes stop_codon:yes gene_type:complete
MIMSDKLLLGLSDQEIDDMENSIDITKMQSFDKHLEDIEIMQLAKNSLKMYIKRFGKNSNIYDKAKDIVINLDRDINETQNHMDML